MTVPQLISTVDVGCGPFRERYQSAFSGAVSASEGVLWPARSTTAPMLNRQQLSRCRKD
jgi:hypothetical protein